MTNHQYPRESCHYFWQKREVMDKMAIETTDEINKLNKQAWDGALIAPKTALETARKALEAALVLKYKKGTADAQLNIGWCSYYLGDISSAYQGLVEAQSIYSGLGDAEGICKAMNALGVYYQEVSRLDKAIEFYTKSMETAKGAGLLERELAAMSNIGELCLDLDNPKEALDYLIKTYEMMPGDTPPDLVANVLWAIGKAFLDLGNAVMAQEFVQKAYLLAEKSGNRLIATDCLETLGRILLSEGDYDGAESYLGQALSLVGTTDNVRQKAIVLIGLGSAALGRGEATEAILKLDQAALICRTVNSKPNLYRAYELLSSAHEKLGNFREALEFHKQFAHYRAEVQNEDTAHKIRNIQIQAEIDKAQQEAEIYRLRTTELKEKTMQLEEYNRQIMSISQIGRMVTASLEYGTVVQTLFERLLPLMDLDFFGITLFDAEKNALVYRRFYEDGLKKGDRVISVDAQDSYTAWTYRNNKPVFIQNSDAEFGRYLEKRPRVRGKSCQSIVCMPLRIEDHLIGTLMVQSYRVAAYSTSHLTLLEALAPYVSIAVENSIIHDRVEELNRALSDEKRRLERATLKISHLANHDSLTGLANRRLLFELLQKSLETAHRAGSKVAIAFIDLDDFKPVNDRYGHAAGDAALVAIAERIKSTLRASDIVARVGGDEFIAAMTNIKHKADMEVIAMKMLEEMATPLDFAGNQCTMGMSMGISMYPDDGTNIEDLINKADSAMYSIKHGQKHAFAFWTESQSPC
jgi:diguanylate cyclase (GGDEF)-like protein